MTAGKSFVFRFEDVEVREREFTLTKAGEVLPVEPKAFRVLLFLLHNPQKLITKEELLDAVWADAAVTESSLTRSIAKLRRVLGDDFQEPHYIETVATVGYRFIGKVEVSEDPSADSQAIKEPNDLSEVLQKPGGWRQLWGWALAGGGVLVLCLAGAIWYLHRSLSPPRITAYTQITHDGHTKDLRGTDGSRLYFTQFSPNGIAQVGVNGGEIADASIAVPGQGLLVTLNDVSRDGSNALIALTGIEDRHVANSLWIAPILGRSARRLDYGSSGDFSPDGSWVIYSTEEGDIFLARIDGTEKRKLANVGSLTGWFRWSPDGKTIRFTKFDGSLWEMNSDGSAIHRLLSDWKESGLRLQCCGDWTSDGRFYLFESFFGPRSELWALDERRGLFRQRPSAPIRLTTGPMQWGTPIPSRDGKKIFSEGVASRGELFRVDPRTGSLQPLLGGISAQYASFSSDGKSVTYVSYPEGYLWKANRDGSNPVQLTGPPNQVILPRWSPDSKQILFVAVAPDGHATSYLVSAIGGISRKLIPEADVDTGDANWSPDGTKVVFDWGWLTSKPEKRELRIIDLNSRQVHTVPGSAGFFASRWSPDGRYLSAFADPSSPPLRIFDFKSEQWTSVPASGEIQDPCFSRDSRYIYLLRVGQDQGVSRIPVAGGKEERVVDLTNWHFTGYFGYGM